MMTATKGQLITLQKERIVELDVLRGLAFLGVVLQHALGVYTHKPDISTTDLITLGLVFNFTKFAVPTFVFVTGIVLFYNYYEQLNYPKFLQKRTTEILIPYILWTGIYTVYYHGTPTFDLLWLKTILKDILLGTGAYHLWFVVLTFQFYLLYPIILNLFKVVRGWITTKQRLVVVVLLLSLAYYWLMWFSSSYIAGGHFQVKSTFMQLLLIKFRDRNSLFFFIYFLFGGMAGIAIYQWRTFVRSAVGWNSLAYAALFVWIGYELLQSFSGGRINLNYSTSLKPSMFLYTVSELLLVYGLALNIVQNNSKLFAVLDFIGKYSYGAYLVHTLVLNYVNQFISRLVPLSNYLWLSMLGFGLCTLVALGICRLISLIPYGKILIGPYGQRLAK